MGELAQLQQEDLSAEQLLKNENLALKKQLYQTQLSYLALQRELNALQDEKLRGLIQQLGE